MQKAITEGSTSKLKGRHAYKLWPKTRMPYGKYEGEQFFEVACKDPFYARWAIKTIKLFRVGFENNRPYMTKMIDIAEGIHQKNMAKKTRR